jgi:hypothetical protein
MTAPTHPIRTVRPDDLVETYRHGAWAPVDHRDRHLHVVELPNERFLLQSNDSEIAAPWRVTAHGLWRIQENGACPDCGGQRDHEALRFCAGCRRRAGL